MAYPTRQRTITLWNGEKILINARTRTYCGNFDAWRGNVNGKKMHCNMTPEIESIEQAMDRCFARWVEQWG